MRLTARNLHKWAGLLAALWLAVLGTTGFLLDHRDWRWMWQAKVDAGWLPEQLVKTADNAVARIIRANPENTSHRLAGSPRGLWRTEDGGKNWQRPLFEGYGARQPQVFSIEADPELGWRRLWVGSDDGVWLSLDEGRTLRPFALPGARVTSLALSGSPGELLGVHERSRIFRLPTTGENVPQWLELSAPAPGAMPERLSLSRWLLDLHTGKGLLSQFASGLINDFAGLAWLVLAISGLLYWLTVRRWKRNRRVPEGGRRILAWLVNSHSSIVGVCAAVPILYLAISGIYYGHFADLSPWAKTVMVGREWQMPAYSPSSWDGWIEGAATYPNEPDMISVGTRLGLFTSRDSGRTWVLEAVSGVEMDAARKVIRIGDGVFVPNGMAAPVYMRQGGDEWMKVHRFEAWVGRHLPAEVMPWSEGKLAWRHGRDLYITDFSVSEIETSQAKLSLPKDDGVPWFYVISRLHSGVLIHPQWKWVNDLFALLALTLVATGLVRWWKRKWLNAVPRNAGNARIHAPLRARQA